jgi:pullulanase/glycogen debranching enzyme
MDYSLKVTNKEVNDYFIDLIALRKNVKVFSLASRNEINSKLSALTNDNGTISYKLTDGTDNYLVVHTCNNKNLTLDGTYRVLLSNNHYSVGEEISSLSLQPNSSIILKAI